MKASGEAGDAAEAFAKELQFGQVMHMPSNKAKLEEELSKLKKKEGVRRERSRSRSLSPRSRALARAQLADDGNHGVDEQKL